jgi:hypothetical protein
MTGVTQEAVRVRRTKMNACVSATVCRYIEWLDAQSGGYTVAMTVTQSDTRTWAAPRLVVLVRGRPEEVLLAACKLAGSLSSGPSADYSRCEGPKHAGMCGKCKIGGKS